MESAFDRYRRRAAHFDDLVAGVRDEQWSAPSPCEGWDARDVVDHVVAMHLHVGGQAGPVPDVPEVATDPAGAWGGVRSFVQRILADPSLASRRCDTPTGPMTVESHIDAVLSDDLVLHGWDLARSTGQDDRIDPRDVEQLWRALSSIPAELMERYRTPGAFGPGIEVYGPEVRVSDSATDQERLLAAVGRDPGWTPTGGPRRVSLLTGEDVAPMSWTAAVRALTDAQSYWLATLHPEGRPQQRPVLAVWVDGALHTTTAAATRKARNLARTPSCSLSVTTPVVDLSVEGRARRVTEPDRLERVAAAYRRKYGWPVELLGDRFDAPYGAPTAGPPPYVPYEIVADSVFSFGTDERHGPRSTRWTF